MKLAVTLPIDYLEYRARALEHQKQPYMWTGMPGQYRHTYRVMMREHYFYEERARYVQCLELIRQIDGWRWPLPFYIDTIEECLYSCIDLEALFFMNVPCDSLTSL